MKNTLPRMIALWPLPVKIAVVVVIGAAVVGGVAFGLLVLAKPAQQPNSTISSPVTAPKEALRTPGNDKSSASQETTSSPSATTPSTSTPTTVKTSPKPASQPPTTTTTGGTTSTGGGSATTGEGAGTGTGTGGGTGGGTVSPPVNTPPTAPTSARLSVVTDTYATIAANPASDSDGIARHEFLRDGVVYASVAGAPNPVYVKDTAVTVGQTYAYTVRAVDTKGMAGPESNTVTVTIPPKDTTPPTLPTNFRLVSNTAAGVTFAWDKSTDDQSSAFFIWYIISSPLDETNFYTWTQTTPYFTGWFDTPGVTHEVYLQAVDFAGNESAKVGPVTFTAL